jgi:hypothetical protein
MIKGCKIIPICHSVSDINELKPTFANLQGYEISDQNFECNLLNDLSEFFQLPINLLKFKQIKLNE